MLASRPDQGRPAATPLGVSGSTGVWPNLYDAVIFLLVVGVFVLVAHGFREMNAPAAQLADGAGHPRCRAPARIRAAHDLAHVRRDRRPR